MNCTNVNLEYKSANKALTTELDRYKEEVKDLKEMQNVENSFLGSNEQYAEIERLKQTLSEQVQEKDSLMKTVSDLKNDLKMEENRNIDREIALEKKIKQLDNIIFKRGQSAQTVHMMTKSKICYDHSTKQAIGFEKPFYLKKVRESKPKLYDGNVILKMDTICDFLILTETLMLCEESRSKMLLKEQDPMVVPKELPKVSMVNTSLKELKRHLAGFDLVVKERTTVTAITEGTWGYTKVIQELLSHISRTCPSINNFDPQLVAVTPRKKDKKVRFAESLTSTENIKTDSTSNIVSNKRVLHSTGVRLSTSASGSQPSGNTRNDKILQTPSSNSKNKVEAHPRNVKSSLNKRNGTVKVNGSASVQNSKKHDNFDYLRKLKGKALDKEATETHFVDPKVFTQIGYIWRPTGRTFTIVGNACPLTRITTTNEVPSRKPIVLECESHKPVVKLVYSRKPRKNKNTESVSKTKVVQIVLWYLDSGCSKHMTGDRSQLTNFISKFLGTVKFRNDQVAKIIGYGDYQIGNVTISRVYYVEGLGHNLFSVGQFCDANLEVAFRQHTCFIPNLEGVDLLTGSRGDNLYTLLLRNIVTPPNWVAAE
ncbi:hypothetical protein Tco_0631392 [Tanacetum coccineum]